MSRQTSNTPEYQERNRGSGKSRGPWVIEYKWISPLGGERMWRKHNLRSKDAALMSAKHSIFGDIKWITVVRIFNKDTGEEVPHAQLREVGLC